MFTCAHFFSGVVHYSEHGALFSVRSLSPTLDFYVLRVSFNTSHRNSRPTNFLPTPLLLLPPFPLPSDDEILKSLVNHRSRCALQGKIDLSLRLLQFTAGKWVSFMAIPLDIDESNFEIFPEYSALYLRWLWCTTELGIF